MKIIILSDMDPNWCWLRDEFPDKNHTWLHKSSQSFKLPIPKKDSFARAIAAFKAVHSSRKEQSILVSHGPRAAYYGAKATEILNPTLNHLAFFNFTDLPVGFQHRTMAKAYQKVNRFVVFTTFEKKMYSEYFNIPSESIDIMNWSVHAPKVDLSQRAIEAGAYICAIGSQGRDYKTLFKAMKTLKHIKLVVVASKENIRNLEIPDNVKIHTNIPLNDAHNILMHSKFMVLPLRDSQVPCGIVTIVSAMFFKKAVLATNSEAVHDYIKDGHSGLLFDANNSFDLSNKITRLWESEVETNTLANNGLLFVHKNCTEETVFRYFKKYLSSVTIS